jgi:hypothetical protein
LALAEKVKLLRNIVFNGYRRAGEILETDEITAQMLINAGMAVPVAKFDPVLFEKPHPDECG